MRRIRFITAIIASTTLSLFAFVPSHAFQKERKPEVIPEDSTKKENELGKRYSEEIEHDKDFKLVKDEARTAQLGAVAKSLAAVSERPKIDYTIKIFEEKDPNAFTLPGGFIYLTTGLLDFVRSDHELAGVLAHEIAHNARMHQLKLMAKERKMLLVDLLTMAGAIMAASSQSEELENRKAPPSRNSNRAAHVYAPILFQRALMAGYINRYSIEYEREADESAFGYLVKTGHNPVGLLTFMERLNLLEHRRPDIDLGVFMTHPPTKERVQAAIDRLRQMKIPLNRSAVNSGPVPRVEYLTFEGGAAAQVRAGDLVLFRIAESTQEQAIARAQKAADQLQKSLHKGLLGFDLRVENKNGAPAVLAGRVVLITVAPQDLTVNAASSPEALASKWIDNIRRLLLRGTIAG